MNVLTYSLRKQGLACVVKTAHVCTGIVYSSGSLHFGVDRSYESVPSIVRSLQEAPKFVSVMTSEKFPLRTVLIDLSGTLHIDDTAIPGAIQALQRLRATDVNIKFVTNTTKESRRVLYERLIKLGFEIEKDEIWSSLWAARDLLATRNLSPLLLVADEALEDFSSIGSNKSFDSVVIGLAPEKFDYKYLNEAFRLILNGAPLIAIHEGRYYKRSDGLALGPGPFVKGLEYATGCKAEVVGKPCGDFFKSALGNVGPKEAIMIGDDVRDDVGGAQSLGMRGFLVKTGKYRPGDETKIDPPPAQVCTSFVEAVDIILKEIKEPCLS